MNPFGIFVIFQAAAEVLTGKRQKESKRDKWLFALLYLALMLGGIAVILFTLYSLYFARR